MGLSGHEDLDMWYGFETSYGEPYLKHAYAQERVVRDKLGTRENPEPDWHFNWIPCQMHLLHLVALTVLDQMSGLSGLPLTKTLTAVTKTVNWYFTSRGAKQSISPDLEVKKVREFVRTRWGSTTDTIADLLKQKDLLSSDALHEKAKAYMQKVAKTNRRFYQRARECLQEPKWWTALESCDIVLNVVKHCMQGVMAASRLDNNSLTKVCEKLPDPTDPNLLDQQLRTTYVQLHNADSTAAVAPNWGPVAMSCHALSAALQLRETPMRENSWYQIKYIIAAHVDRDAAEEAVRFLKKRVENGVADSLIVEMFHNFPGELEGWIDGTRMLPSKAFVREYGGAVPASLNTSQEVESSHFSTGYCKLEGGGNTSLSTANIRSSIRTSKAPFPFKDFKNIYNKELSCWARRKKTHNTGNAFSGRSDKEITEKAKDVMVHLYSLTKEKPDIVEDANLFEKLYPRGDKRSTLFRAGANAGEATAPQPLDLKKLDVAPGDLVVVGDIEQQPDAHLVVTTTASDAVLVLAEDTDVPLKNVVQNHVDADMVVDTAYPTTSMGSSVTTLSSVIQDNLFTVTKKQKPDDATAAPAPAAATSSSSAASASAAVSAKAKGKAKSKSAPKAKAAAAEQQQGAEQAFQLYVMKRMCQSMWYSFKFRQQRLAVKKDMCWERSAWPLRTVIRERARAGQTALGWDNVMQRVVGSSPGRRTAKEHSWKEYDMYRMVPEIVSSGIPAVRQVFYITYSIDTKMWNMHCHRGWKPGVSVESLGKLDYRINTTKYFGRSDRKEAIKVACNFFGCTYKDASLKKQEFATKYLKKYIADNARSQLNRDLNVDGNSDSDSDDAHEYRLGLELIV